jgi:hypothetical protein
VVGVIIANWAVLAPMLKEEVKTAWVKSIEWRDMVNDIKNLKILVDQHSKDLKAAHDKLRDLKKAN